MLLLQLVPPHCCRCHHRHCPAYCLVAAHLQAQYRAHLTVAAAEAAIGLAILVVFFRNRGSIAVEDVNVMKG